MNVSHDNNSLPHSDIKSDSFVDRFAPPQWIPYLKLARIDRPIGIWLLLFPGWWAIILAAGSPFSPRFELKHWGLMILFALGAVLMRSAGCVINDLWDKNLDAQVERTRPRPLASGAISVRQALAFLFFLLSASLAILLTMNVFTVILGALSLIPVVIYPLMKRITWWPQAFLGMTFNWGALMGWSAVTGELSLAAFILYAASILWTLGYDTIYAHQDKEDDARIGIKSTALLFGEQSRQWVGLFYAFALIGFFLAKLYANSPMFLTPMFMLPLGAFVYWQVNNWDMNSPADCLKKFRANQAIGWLILLVFCL